MKNLTCKVFGHKYDSDEIYYYEWYKCLRCESESLKQEYGLTQIAWHSFQLFLSSLKYSKFGSWIRYKLRGKNALPF